MQSFLGSNPLIIEQATAKDIATVLPLVVQFFQEESLNFERQRLALALTAMVNDSRSAIFIAWNAQTAVAFATVTTTSPGLEFARYAELEDLYVLPLVRQKGVGRALIQRVKQWCNQNECSVLAVVVTAEDQANRELISYYQAQGFHTSTRTTLFHYLTHPL